MKFDRYLVQLVRDFERAFKRLGMPCDEVAAAAEIHQHTLERLMDGTTFQPRLSTVYKIATACDLALELIDKQAKAKRRAG